VNGDVLVLGIETSCDETAASVVKNGRDVLSCEISSQFDQHRVYGGIVPEIASRRHMELIEYTVNEALACAGVKRERVACVAVTNGPGLVGSLLVGLSYAKALGFSWNIPFIGVNHIKAHIFANFIGNDVCVPPFLCLVVSGGHTHLFKVYDYDRLTVIGRTMDDAAGEAFDKVSRTLGLTYPGGPAIDNAAKRGNPKAFSFPKANMKEYDFSFSGLKSAVINVINQYKLKNQPIPVEDIAASFQQTVVDVLCDKIFKGLAEYGFNKAALAGGVAANSLLRSVLRERCHSNGIELYMPLPVYCTDNGAMTASCGYYEYLKGNYSGINMNAFPNLTFSFEGENQCNPNLTGC